MTCTHITITLSDSLATCQISVFSVHVVGTTARVIPQPNTKVFDLKRPPLINSADTDNFTGRLFQFSQLTQKVPETALGHSFVRGKYPHLIEGRDSIFLRGQTP